MPTFQELFNRSVRGIISQGGPAVNYGSVSCMYRTPDGRKCAAGWLISDDDYVPDMEGRTFGDTIHGVKWPLREYRNEIRMMQDAHDVAALQMEDNLARFWLVWKRQLADRFPDLNLSVLSEILV